MEELISLLKKNKEKYDSKIISELKKLGFKPIGPKEWAYIIETYQKPNNVIKITERPLYFDVEFFVKDKIKSLFTITEEQYKEQIKHAIKIIENSLKGVV